MVSKCMQIRNKKCLLKLMLIKNVNEFYISIKYIILY